ncbi:MAG: MarR family transcriptional regulator [Acidobacteria bacterium]|nr:MarR family transcriptional regulator [Acidobacteriota bacterium]
MDRKDKARIADGALLPSGALLEAQTAVADAIQRGAVPASGLSPALADLLTRLFLAPENRLRGVDIARQLAITPSRASRLIDRAEAAGVARRGIDPDDRRAQQVVLTEKGRERLHEFIPALLGVVDAVVHEELSEAERDTLVDLLRRVSRRARRYRPDSD